MEKMLDSLVWTGSRILIRKDFKNPFFIGEIIFTASDAKKNTEAVWGPLQEFQLIKRLTHKGGWLSKYTEPGKYQIWDRLRKLIEGSLIGRDAEKFIENYGSKHYRISTHPDSIVQRYAKTLRK